MLFTIVTYYVMVTYTRVQSVGSCPIEFMMEAACLRAPVFHGAPGKPDVATPDRPC